MIHKVTDTSELKDVYFEDIDALVGSQDEAFLVYTFYFYYYSTLEAAQEKCRSLGVSEELAEG